jgi:hypothetical protein
MASTTSPITLRNHFDCEDERGLGREGSGRRLLLPPILGFRSSVSETRAGSLMMVLAAQVGDARVGSGWGELPGSPKGPHVWPPVHPSPCVLPCRS